MRITTDIYDDTEAFTIAALGTDDHHSPCVSEEVDND